MRAQAYERVWLAICGVMLVAFLGAIAVTTFVLGHQLPGHAERIDPAHIARDPRFATPGLVEVGPGRYDAYMVAHIWSFQPSELRLPQGARVSFHVVSPDVTHGFEVVGTNVNGMVIPGYVTHLEHRFDRPGEYLILCNEYCGAGHQFMQARIIVE